MTWKALQLVSVLMIGFIGTTICFFPLIFGNAVDRSNYENLDDIPLRQGLLSKDVHTSLVACIAVTVPIFIDFSIDSYWYFKRTTAGLLAMWTLLLSSIFPVLFLFAFALPSSLYLSVPAVMSTRSTLILCCGLSLLNIHGSHLWTIKSTLILSSMVCLLFSIDSFQPFLGHDFLLFSSWFKPVTTCFGLFLFSIQCLRWIYILIPFIKTKQQLPLDYFICTVHLCALTFLLISLAIIYGIYSKQDWLDRSSEFITSQNYIFTAYSVLVTVLNSRIVRKEMNVEFMKRESENKRMIVGYFSHEIRTPLNTVLMGLQLLERDFRINYDKFNNEEFFDTISDLHGSCDAAVDILNDLLTFEQLDGDKIDLDMKYIPVISFFEDKIEALMLRKREKLIDFNLIFNDADVYQLKIAHIIGDEMRLSHVMRNILANAFKNSEVYGTVTLTVSLKRNKNNKSKNKIKNVYETGMEDLSYSYYNNNRGSNNNNYSGNNSNRGILCIEVVDSGRGLDKDELIHLFQESINFKAGVLREGSGTDLGLWISKRIVNLHGGSVTAHSEGIGHGCTFTIELPVYLNNNSNIDIHVLTAQNSLYPGTMTSPSSLPYDINGGGNNVTSSPLPMPLPLTPINGLISLPSNNVSRLSQLFNINQFHIPMMQLAATTAVTTTTMAVTAARTSTSLVHPMENFNYDNFSINESNTNNINSTNNSNTNTSSVLQYNRQTSKYSLPDYDQKRPPLQLPSSTSSAIRPSLENRRSISRPSIEKMRSGNVISFRSSKCVLRSRVLVVDDAPLNRKMLCRLLQGHCHSTVVAEDGLVAVELVRISLSEGHPFDLILMDYQMPNMDGPTATAKIRSLGFTNPIIGVTGNALPCDVHTFITHGALRVLCKPLEFNVLKRALLEIGCSHLLSTPSVSVPVSRGITPGASVRAFSQRSLSSMSNFSKDDCGGI